GLVHVQRWAAARTVDAVAVGNLGTGAELQRLQTKLAFVERGRPLNVGHGDRRSQMEVTQRHDPRYQARDKRLRHRSVSPTLRTGEQASPIRFMQQAQICAPEAVRMCALMPLREWRRA